MILGQLMPVANLDPQINLENHQFKDHEVCLFVPIYNKATGMHGDLTKKLAHITLRGDLMRDSIHMALIKKKVPYCIV